MDKFFAKPLFLGKKVIFLTQCHSTNDELSSLIKKESVPEGTVIYTDHQFRGRGQRGDKWEDEPGKSILFSILLKPNALPVSSQYLLNLITGLAVLNTLKEKTTVSLKLKWPNDIYLNNKKIAGVLIENNVKGGKIEFSVVGIGLNLNQKIIKVHQATSLLFETGVFSNRDDFLENLLISMEYWYLKLTHGRYPEIREAYHYLLLWKDEVHIFRDAHSVFKGVIKGIDEYGGLIIEKEDERLTYGTKEIQFVS
ncbi:MAG: biotin--[acetyl-CoA-carboxylase] ligase [Bacteroidota bacterium]